MEPLCRGSTSTTPAPTVGKLPDMPRARDHFQAAVAGDTLYTVGGRERDLGTEIAATDA